MNFVLCGAALKWGRWNAIEMNNICRTFGSITCVGNILSKIPKMRHFHYILVHYAEQMLDSVGATSDTSASMCLITRKCSSQIKIIGNREWCSECGFLCNDLNYLLSIKSIASWFADLSVRKWSRFIADAFRTDSIFDFQFSQSRFRLLSSGYDYIGGAFRMPVYTDLRWRFVPVANNAIFPIN